MAAKKDKKDKKTENERFYPEIKPEYETVIMLIVHSGMSIKSIAETLSNPHTTVYHWTQLKEFQTFL